MMAVKLEKKKLSKSILEMKFMKRSKEKIEKEQYEEKGKAMFASELTQAMEITGSKIIVEPSFVPCENLLVGRWSYRGMNPEIEKLMEAEKLPKETDPKETEADVSDLEMARRYNSLISTISNKFKKGSKRANTNVVAPKHQFKKPKY